MPDTIGSVTSMSATCDASMIATSPFVSASSMSGQNPSPYFTAVGACTETVYAPSGTKIL